MGKYVYICEYVWKFISAYHEMLCQRLCIIFASWRGCNQTGCACADKITADCVDELLLHGLACICVTACWWGCCNWIGLRQYSPLMCV